MSYFFLKNSDVAFDRGLMSTAQHAIDHTSTTTTPPNTKQNEAETDNENAANCSLPKISSCAGSKKSSVSRSQRGFNS